MGKKKKKKETNNNAALNFGGRVSTPHSVLHTLQTRVEVFFFSFWRLKRKEMSKTNCKKSVFLGQIHVLRGVSENIFLSSQKPKPRRLLGF